ncbi:MAG TPA: hypothetical protein VF099_16860 [Ktedonobacterales bacterium]
MSLASALQDVKRVDYAFGALLCTFSTYVSIGFIVLAQFNYAIASCIRPLERL